MSFTLMGMQHNSTLLKELTFCGICPRQCHYKFNTVYWKSCIVFCAKQKEVDRKKTHFSMTNKSFDSTQLYNYIIYNWQQHIKINRIRTSMIATLSFLIENIYNRNNVPLVQWYTILMSPEGVCPKVSPSLRLLVLCHFRLELFVIYYCLFIFFKELISFMDSFDKCHTSIFNALIISFILLPNQNFLD